MLQHLLTKNVLAGSNREVTLLRGRRDFSDFVGEDQFLARVLGSVAVGPPWSYWDPEVLRIALRTLEDNSERSIQAIAAHLDVINVAVSEWLRASPAGNDEAAISFPTTSDLIRLVSNHHPEYLRRAEHIFGNVLRLYWGVVKKKGVDGSFDMKGALAVLSSKRLDNLSKEYVEDIRNAIAHGQVVFTGIGIKYGPCLDCEMHASDFLHELDTLWATCNSLLFALIIFSCRTRSLNRPCHVPFRLGVLFAEVEASYPGFGVENVVESNYPVLGRQLHISVFSPFRSRDLCRVDCCRLSMYLLKFLANRFDRFVFQIEHFGKSISSQLIVDAVQLGSLLREGASSLRISEALHAEAELLWYDQSHLSAKWRALGILCQSRVKLERLLIDQRRQTAGAMLPSKRYKIRSIEDKSVGRCIRLHVRACLLELPNADDRTLIREVLRSIIHKVRHQWYCPKADGLSRRLPLWGRPKVVWVSLYRRDKPTRALSRSGYADSNLVAEAERLYGLVNSPVLVKNPDEISRKLRIRYDSSLPE